MLKLLFYKKKRSTDIELIGTALFIVREIFSEHTSDILAQGLSKLERLRKNWSSVVMVSL